MVVGSLEKKKSIGRQVLERPSEIIEEIKTSNLRVGVVEPVSTGLKWSFMNRFAPGEALSIILMKVSLRTT